MLKHCTASLMGIVLVAQTAPEPNLKNRHNNIWLCNGDLLLLPNDPDHKESPGVVISKKERKILPQPPGPKPRGKGLPFPETINAPEGAIFHINSQLKIGCRESGTKNMMQVKIYEFNLKYWVWNPKPYATLIADSYFSTFLISKDYLLGIAIDSNTFKKDGKRFPFAIFRRNEDGIFSLDHFEAGGMSVHSQSRRKYPILDNLWLQADPVWTARKTIITTGSGIFWCFGLNGKLEHTFKLFDGINDIYLQRSAPWAGTLLGCQPDREGELIVSCLSEEAAVTGKSLAIGPAFNGLLPDAERFWTRTLDSICSRWPRVEWYKVDPAKGTKKAIPPPLNIPRLVTDTEEYMRFNWTLTLDGNIRMYQ